VNVPQCYVICTLPILLNKGDGIVGNQSHEVAERKIHAHSGDRTPVAELASVSVHDV